MQEVLTAPQKNIQNVSSLHDIRLYQQQKPESSNSTPLHFTKNFCGQAHNQLMFCNRKIQSKALVSCKNYRPNKVFAKSVSTKIKRVTLHIE